jgi:hypothetical protein
MPPLRGPSAVPPDRLVPTCALADPFHASSSPRPWQGRHRSGLAVAALAVAVCSAQAQAQTTAVGDRYSGDVYVQPAYRQAADTTGPTLSWPGKTVAVAPQIAPPSPSSGFGEPMRAPAYAYAAQPDRPASTSPYQTPVTRQVAPEPTYQAPTYQAPSYQAAPRYQPAPYPAQVVRASAAQPHAYGAPPVMPWYQRYGAAETSSAPAPAPAAPSPPQAGAPQSIYDPPAGQGGAATGSSSPAATPTPTPTAANGAETARFYSLHRQYGLTPDPDPIPPQFFTRTADLSDPPGPSPVFKAATSSGGSTTAVHTVQSDDSTSTLSQP